MRTSWTLTLILGALSFVSEACELPGRMTQYNLMDQSGCTNLVDGSHHTDKTKFQEDWNIADGRGNMHVNDWGLEEGAYVVEWGYPGNWWNVRVPLRKLKNQDVLPFVTSMIFETDMQRSSSNPEGERYTINMSLQTEPSGGEVLQEVSYTDWFTGVAGDWMPIKTKLDLDLQDVTRDLWLHLAVQGEDEDGKDCDYDTNGNLVCYGVAMANHSISLETYIRSPPYSWGGSTCSSNGDVASLDIDAKLGMSDAVTIDLPWFDVPWPFDTSLYTEKYLIKSAADFEAENCADVKSFYDCFSGVEKIINEGRWQDFNIQGPAGSPQTLTVSKYVDTPGEFYVTHVVEPIDGINKYSNLWSSWKFKVGSGTPNVRLPTPTPAINPVVNPVEPTPTPAITPTVDTVEPTLTPVVTPTTAISPMVVPVAQTDGQSAESTSTTTTTTSSDGQSVEPTSTTTSTISSDGQSADPASTTTTTTSSDSNVFDQTMTDAQEHANEAKDWLQDNQWCIGIIYLVAGPLIALFGTAWFPYITASLVAIFTISLCILGGEALDWTATTGGSIGVLCAAIVLGIIAGMIVRRNIWLMVGLLGAIAGFFSGNFLYAFIAGLSSWEAVWGYWLIVSVCALAGCLIACKKGVPIVMICTAFAGSYLFMRSWTLFFPGNWPSESDIMSGASIQDYGSMFWVYIGVLAASFAIALTFQCHFYKHVHHELDEYAKSHHH